MGQSDNNKNNHRRGQLCPLDRKGSQRANNLPKCGTTSIRTTGATNEIKKLTANKRNTPKTNIILNKNLRPHNGRHFGRLLPGESRKVALCPPPDLLGGSHGGFPLGIPIRQTILKKDLKKTAAYLNFNLTHAYPRFLFDKTNVSGKNQRARPMGGGGQNGSWAAGAGAEQGRWPVLRDWEFYKFCPWLQRPLRNVRRFFWRV